MHLLGAEGRRRQHRHQGGIDAAAQAQQGFAEAAFARVIPHPQHQGPQQQLLIRGDGGRLSGLAGFPAGQIRGTEGQLGAHGAAGSADEAAAIEDQLVIASHLVDVDHRSAQPLGRALGELPPQVRFALAEGGGREIDQQVGSHRGQVPDGISAEQPLAVQVLLDPEVLANGQAQAPAAAVSLKLQQAGLFGRAEVAPFIEDVVAGEQAFARHDPPAALLHEGHAVEQIGLLAIANRFADPQQQRLLRWEVAGERPEHVLLPLPQGRPQQQVPRGIAPERQFRRDHQIGSVSGGAAAGRQQLGAIAAQVPHQGIDLGQGDAH